MICAEKGNKVLNIAEEDISRFIAQGFNITDGKGKLLERGIPTDVSSYKAECSRLNSIISDMQKTIDELKQEIETLKSKKTTTSKDTSTEEVVTDKPKRRKSSKVEE